jgi:hypothetical protein
MSNKEWWKEKIEKATSVYEIELVFRRLFPGSFAQPFRKPLFDFPDAIIHATETAVKKHPHYKEAKAGDEEAAMVLVQDTVNNFTVQELKETFGGINPVLVSAHAFEAEGINAIPEAFAEILSDKTGFSVESGIIQTNSVKHTGAGGFSRMARQALFDGDVTAGREYLLVDDFIGQGGTLANLKGFIESKGGIVVGATVLTGKPYSAKLAPHPETLEELRKKHGKELEKWWLERFGHPFDCLTQSEARYLLNSPDADTIRDRIIAEEQAGNRGSDQKPPESSEG